MANLMIYVTKSLEVVSGNIYTSNGGRERGFRKVAAACTPLMVGTTR
jgi:hypothetical protein